MGKTDLPLEDISIEELYNGVQANKYEVPIYQRNYAWEKEEISDLIRDVYDSFVRNPNKPYYIGTLVSFAKGDDVYEIIDGQQRLTTIRLVLSVLSKKVGAKELSIKSSLTYRARKKSNDTIKALESDKRPDEEDEGIKNGLKYIDAALSEYVICDIKDFEKYFRKQVHIIHYRVPRDIDLNHYFEIMNSRGEQLEKHEIVKARLLSVLSSSGDTDVQRHNATVFSKIWDACSEMDVYVQQKMMDTSVFGPQLDSFTVSSFENFKVEDNNDGHLKIVIKELIDRTDINISDKKNKNDRIDTFQPIINFPNFLLIVLKLTRVMLEDNFDCTQFNLDDKDLIKEFDKVKADGLLTEGWVKQFSYNLLKARYFLDNCIIHHSNEEETSDSNPWRLEKWYKIDSSKQYFKNYSSDEVLQRKLVQLLSMFEVSFTARQRKNYLFYCLLYLFSNGESNIDKYAEFIENLAKKYFFDVYLDNECLNDINTPLPGSFDEKILDGKKLSMSIKNSGYSFADVYGDGTIASKGIPLFVFNYLDYRLWSEYTERIQGEKYTKDNSERRLFFDELGCSDFGRDIFRKFFFSRTRRSLEHYYPQAKMRREENGLDENQINCLGNYAMIGAEANSSGSDWDPITKTSHYYKDTSKKIPKISVASLKFMIMMQKCKDNEALRNPGDEWNFDDIKNHQRNMLALLLKENIPKKESVIVGYNEDDPKDSNGIYHASRIQSVSREILLKRGLIVGDSFNTIYEAINTCFGKEYAGYQRGWYDVDDEYAAWFPKLAIIENGELHSASHKGWVNQISEDGSNIYEYNENQESIEPSERAPGGKYLKKRIVFAKADGEKYKFQGVFQHDSYDPIIGNIYKKVADTYKVV